jgi:hypothetical protein
VLFRLTKKAAAKLRLEVVANESHHASMIEWYCNLVVVQRRHFFLFTQATTLFSFWIPAAGIKGAEFGRAFREGARDVLAGSGIHERDVEKMVDHVPDVYGKAADRGVIGSMVDFAKMVEYVADDRGGLDHLSLHEMNHIANDCPMSKIGMEQPLSLLQEILRSNGAA